VDINIKSVRISDGELRAIIINTCKLVKLDGEQTLAGISVVFQVQHINKGETYGPFIVLIPEGSLNHRSFQLALKRGSKAHVAGLISTRNSKLYPRESLIVAKYLAGKPLFIEEFWATENMIRKTGENVLKDAIAMREAKAAYENMQPRLYPRLGLLSIALFQEMVRRRHSLAGAGHMRVGNVNTLAKTVTVIGTIEMVGDDPTYVDTRLHILEKGYMRLSGKKVVKDSWIRILDPAVHSYSVEIDPSSMQYIQVVNTEQYGHGEYYIPLNGFEYDLVK